MNTKQLIAIISDFPIDQRVEVVSQIPHGLTFHNPDIEKAWARGARRRLDEFEEGKTEAIPGAKVHEQLREKYSQ